MDSIDPTVPDLNAAAWQGVVVMFQAGDPGELAGLIEEFERAARTHLARIEVALAEGNAPAIERSIHTLKSSSGYLGAARLEALCAAIQRLARDGEVAAIRDLYPDLAATIGRTLAAIREKLASFAD